jgi:hypothetical protein
MESSKTRIGIGIADLPKPTILLSERQIGEIDHATCPRWAF